MNVSVILTVETISPRLTALLTALRFQTYTAFEIVLVTAAQRPTSADFVKTLICAPWHPATAKNLGAMHSAGDVLAFLDGNSIPDRLWLKELTAAYEMSGVAAAGAPIGNVDGEPCYTADRLGNRLDAVRPPYWAYQLPFTDRFLCLHPGNCSFLRTPFLDIGGFDETLGEELAQVDLCMRLTDRGHLIQPRRTGLVYQTISGVAHAEQAITNQVRFAVRSSNALAKRDEVLSHWQADTDDMDRAIFEGVAVAVLDREPAPLQPMPTAAFQRYPTRQPLDRKFTLCFTASQFPANSGAPDDRQTWNLARGLAERGHETHLFVAGDTVWTDFEQGVWVHRVAEGDDAASAIHRAIMAFAHTRYVDLVVVCGCEGIHCVHDRTLVCIVDLRSTLMIPLDDRGGATTPEMEQVLLRDRLLLRSANNVIVSDPDLLCQARKCHGAPFAPARIHQCRPVVQDRAADFTARQAGMIRILFVGSLQLDHGIDLLLDAAEKLLGEGLDFDLALTGDADGPSDFGPSFRALIGRRSSETQRRVFCTGDLSEGGLFQALADSDVICLPYGVDAAAIPCLEAMMFGKAVVASDFASVRDVLRDDGLRFPPGDSNLLADCLRQLIRDGELRTRLGRQARRRYETGFATDAAIDTVLSAYAQIVDASVAEVTAR